ncbi:MBL fold metallo-hydrolase [Salipaludibacillus aurantiacus]|uniref:Phosphoribosyl 1,2-cyclic phosphodiesterase n=1 Tax=Salipaludibacillus aurantiacus TaxID=1601833 RepID=A0A1H9U122_9BACI|nr:MBL fold metallo-hydrolase [Salipaludibacillus aurantiacus]SES03146.1 Phosphoribosyl 1,2-cyclic phosphodiesterase [Salipaludibacillus aurantiacus]
MIEIKTLASGSQGNCYHITDGRTALLIEAGISFKEIRRQLDFQTSNIAGCLVSHEHKDHCKAVPDVLRAGINVYMSEGTASEINAAGHRIKHVKSKQSFRLGTWTVLPFDVQHDVSEPLGFLLANQAGDKLLFASDTYYIKYKFKGLTHLLLECNYSLDILNENIEAGRIHKAMKHRLLRSHFSLENVKEFLKANDLSKVQEIHLLHLSDSNSDEERFKREIQELTGKLVYVS